jgi:uncharacterized alkaline shock family protein YloU
MSETRTERSTDLSSDQAPKGSRAPSGDATEITTAHGKTKIEDVVVAKIADLAAREIPRAHDSTPLSTAKMLSGMASSLASRVTGGSSGQPAQRVNVVVGEIEAAVDLGMSVDYGENIPQIAGAVRSNIIGRIQAMRGLIVKEVNIDVTDLYFPARRTRARRRFSSGANAPSNAVVPPKSEARVSALLLTSLVSGDRISDNILT